MLKPLIPPLSHPHRILGLSAPLNFTQEQGRGSKWVKVQQCVGEKKHFSARKHSLYLLSFLESTKGEAII